MNKSDLITDVAARTSISEATVKRVFEVLLDTIREELAREEQVKLKGFGAFKLRSRAARMIRNPQTGALMEIPAARIPQFKPGRALKKLIAARQRRERGLPKVITVTSGKGGTGKTNFVINSAIALAQRGLKVFIIDADLGTANVDVLLGIHTRLTIGNLVDRSAPDLMDIVVDGPGGIRLVPGGSGLAALADLSRDKLNRLIHMLKPLEEQADVILIDTGSGVSRNVVEFALAADEIVVVVTPEPHSITDAYALIKVLSKRNMLPPLKLIINLVDGPAEAKNVYAKFRDVTERFLGITPEPLGYVVKDAQVASAVKKFKPFVLHSPAAPASKCIVSIAQKLSPVQDASIAEPDGKRMPNTGFLQRLKRVFSK